MPAALLAAGFLAAVHQLENVLWDDLPDGLGYSSPPWFLVIALPAIGAAIVAIARATLPGDGGHIVAEASDGVVLAVLAAKAIAYGICLGCGFRGGPVFPAIFIGVALAALAVVALDMSPTVAIAMGTAAGMAAATRLVLASLVVAALLVGTVGVDAIPAAVLAAVAAWLTVSALDPPAPAPAPA